MFYSSLQSAISNSGIYSSINLKAKQVKCLEAIYCGRDVVAVLPTGYGKSMIFHLLPALLHDKLIRQSSEVRPVVIVVSPLNALTKDQIRKASLGKVKAAALNVKRKRNAEELEVDVWDASFARLKDGDYDLMFTHPEAFLSCKEGMNLFQSARYQHAVKAIVIDEAHCILECKREDHFVKGTRVICYLHHNNSAYRGDDFRKDYSRLASLCATFPSVPVVALTATASKSDVAAIKSSLNLKTPLEVIANPNRENIFYDKVFRQGEDVDFLEELLKPIAEQLKEKTVSYPLTVLYLPLKWCGFAFKYFDRQFGINQYYPATAEPLPENRMFAQFHAPQTRAMKDQILKELSSPTSKVRVIFATVAMGMGVDIPSIRHVIHVGPPRTIREYFQETGRAGRDRKPASAVLYYNNVDISKSKAGMTEDIRKYCRLENNCLRKFLLKCLDARETDLNAIGHLCCSYCKSCCSCQDCFKEMQ